jgi:hypothetical protein
VLADGGVGAPANGGSILGPASWREALRAVVEQRSWERTREERSG